MPSKNETIMDFAVAYHAFFEAAAKQDWSGVIVWGRMLLERNKTLGGLLALSTVRTVNESVAQALKNEKEAA